MGSLIELLFEMKVRNAFPEKQLLVPEKTCFVADFMHLVGCV